MPSSKEDGTATAAEQLGFMSLGTSAERKHNATENDEDAEENGDPAKFCSACEKESETLKKCTACKCVWYCNKACQKRHRKEHKKECKRIKRILDDRGGVLNLGTETDIGPLGKVPPREECPICMRVFPLHAELHAYFPCCGKTICCGCDFQHCVINEDHEGSEREQTPVHVCAFCRSSESSESDGEHLVQLRKRVKLKDPDALSIMAVSYGYGHNGLPVDQAKCIVLLRESADLGDPISHYQLGLFYHEGKMGLHQNEEEAIKYWEKAAEGGHVLARHYLGVIEGNTGDHVAAIRHFQLSASGGHRGSMGALIQCFEDGFLQHQYLAETLLAFYRSSAEMRSEDRDIFIKHLKRIGEYKEEYEYASSGD